jgi:hypothetical protein
MGDRRAVYKDACSQLHDKKNTTRESALENLVGHIVQCEEIDEQLEYILESTLYALERGSNIPVACQIIERVIALNPNLPNTRSVVSSLLNILEKQFKSSQRLFFSVLFRCTAFVLALISTFNAEFSDSSHDVLRLFNLVTLALRHESKQYYTHSLDLVTGLTCAYIALIPPYRAGWGYDRYVSLLLFFMTKNYNLDIAPKLFALTINGILLAIQAKHDPIAAPLYPDEIITTYQNQIVDDHNEDDGYYLPLDASEDNHNEIAIPIINWGFEPLIQRIESIFDGESLELVNEYLSEDLDMFNSIIRNDLYNLRQQLQLAQQAAKADGRSLVRDSKNGMNNSNKVTLVTPISFILPELDNHKHPLNHHLYEHYTSFEGRGLYFSLPIFGISWDKALNWSYLGELLTSDAIKQRCQDLLLKSLEKEFHTDNAYERRMGKKEHDLFVKQGIEEKLKLMQSEDNELDIGGGEDL